MAQPLLPAVLLLACTSAALAQPSAPSGGFAVASIRPTRSGGIFTAETVPRVAIQPGGRVTARNSSLRELIVVAHGLLDYQVVDGPDWIESERFDIDARAERELSPDEARAMLKALLAERFALKVRSESRALPVYALVAARDDGTFGPQLRRAGEACAKPVPPAGLPPIPPPPPPPPGQQMTLLNLRWPRRCPSLMAPGYLSMRDISMDEFAARLPALTDRTVINQTGWTGQFDFDLQFTPEFLPASVSEPPIASAPSLFTAVREQLGLRLDSRRRPVDVVVVDSVERPTEN